MSDLIVIHTKNRNGRAYGRSLRLRPKEVKHLSYPGWFALHAKQFKLKSVSRPIGDSCTRF